MRLSPKNISSSKIISLVWIPRLRAVPPMRKRSQPIAVRIISSIMKAKKRCQNPP
ncbi:MAG: hypothetical protein NTV99_00445 [Deltaproteobacteria bacterium]|nr:hypothetical protein [Deltaproteobacteria bacterium]